ncbi:hypothetical protein [Pseudovibrio exalbescens]|uniref:hypothetical protein n=1 Tax=Pseudovibrio exalbescens TaxID=197461 RepID=UPI0011AEC4EE|nr:hypothetical protein [Pseudovibrio exalbescens]
MDIWISFTSPESGFNWSDVLPYTPHLLWALFFASVFFIVGPRTIRAAFSRATKLGFAGVELELSGEMQEVERARDITLPASLRNQLTRRMKTIGPQLRSSRILWIDDNPSNNSPEISILQKLGVLIDLAKTDEEAREKMEGAVYDIVISDMERENDGEAGLKLLPEVLSSISNPFIIFYVGVQRDTPQGAFGLTIRPDELFNLILDATERRKS